MSDPKRIFLQPGCCVDWFGEGRQWCEYSFVWDGEDCEDHQPAVEYVHASEIERLKSLLEGRDKFIVDEGLWDKFCRWPPARTTLRADQ